MKYDNNPDSMDSTQTNSNTKWKSKGNPTVDRRDFANIVEPVWKTQE